MVFHLILHFLTFGALVGMCILLLRSHKEVKKASEWVRWYKKVEADLRAQLREEQLFRRSIIVWLDIECQAYKDSKDSASFVKKAMKQRFEEQEALLSELRMRRQEM